MIGPPFFKIALRLSGEAYIDRIGGAQLLTIEGQAPQIQMKKVAWEVRAGPRGSRVAQVVPGRTQARLERMNARRPAATAHDRSRPRVLLLYAKRARPVASRSSDDRGWAHVVLNDT